VSKARQSLGSTRNITGKYNELFQELVTDRYKAIFQSILERFRFRVKVTIDTYGQKGETLRQIALNPEVYPTRYPVERVLSDGEKMAVAVADFLTEATLDDSACGIILDDPVTSLDSEWKSVLADCLVEYAEGRQVVLFTHDLTFLYRITEQAEKRGVEMANHWIRHEIEGPGYIYTDNSPVCEGNYKSAKVARDCYAKVEGFSAS
jgi:wobble nucleotide-excising tRNase